MTLNRKQRRALEKQEKGELIKKMRHAEGDVRSAQDMVLPNAKAIASQVVQLEIIPMYVGILKDNFGFNEAQLERFVQLCKETTDKRLEEIIPTVTEEVTE